MRCISEGNMDNGVIGLVGLVLTLHNVLGAAYYIVYAQ